MRYNDYYMQVLADAKNAVDENVDYYEDFDEFYDNLWCDDSVTGNGSGSYFFNSAKAAEACGEAIFDEKILQTVEMMGEPLGDYLDKGPETIDVVIRVAMLQDVYSDVKDYWDEKKAELAEE